MARPEREGEHAEIAGDLGRRASPQLGQGGGALLIGVFNSIMFPTIFSLALERAKAPQAATSGLLTLGIVGGACLPPIAGVLADRSGDMTSAFAVPALAYAAVVAFAATASVRKFVAAKAGP